MSQSVISRFSNSIWKKEEEKFFKKLENELRIPNKSLKTVDSITLKKQSDFDCIPNTGGCYWIWTNEPVNHRFHSGKIPYKVNEGELIYNGITIPSVRSRAKNHLLGRQCASWSGVSLDVYFGEYRSHQKKILSPKLRAKLPYVEYSPEELNRITEKKQILKMFLSKDEINFVKKNDRGEYYFRNGINIFEPKHKNFEFIFYFITGLHPLYAEYIETQWRRKYGTPKLCSYSQGR